MKLVKCIYQGFCDNLKEGAYYAVIEHPFYNGEYIIPNLSGHNSVGKHHFVVI